MSKTKMSQSYTSCYQQSKKSMKIPSGQIIASEATKFPTNFERNDFTRSAQ